MIEVLYGICGELINEYIDNFVKKNNITNIINYDYNETNIESVLEEASYPDLFGDKKLILLYNCDFLTGSDKLESPSLEKYLNNPNENNYLFFITYSESLDERKKIVKLLREKYKVNEFNKFSEYDALKYIKKLFEEDNYKIDDKSINEIYKRLSNNISLIKNEVNKLKLYKLEEKEINIQDVYEVTTKLPEDNVFKIVDAVTNNNKEEIFRLYDDFKLMGVDEISLIGLISSQFRFMLQVKILLNDKKTKNEIISLLKSHPYKTDLTIKNVSSYSEEKLKNILYDLALMDISIKTGEVDKSYALENFFLNL